MLLRLKRRQGCASALDQHLAQVLAAAFGDAEQTRLASCRRLPRNKPEPGGEIATSCERLRITHGRDERSRVEAPIPGMLVSRRAASSRFGLCCELRVECRDPLIEPLPPRQHVVDQKADTRSSIARRSAEEAR